MERKEWLMFTTSKSRTAPKDHASVCSTQTQVSFLLYRISVSRRPKKAALIAKAVSITCEQQVWVVMFVLIIGITAVVPWSCGPPGCAGKGVIVHRPASGQCSLNRWLNSVGQSHFKGDLEAETSR